MTEQNKNDEKRSLINLENFDFVKEPVFFGKSMSIERYDKFRYPAYFKLFENQMEFFWKPDEIDTGKDRVDYKNMTDNEKFIFTSNLKYQILLDSIQSYGIPYLTEHLSNPEVHAFCSIWQFFETLHSYSYTYIIKNVYNQPGEIFDNITNDPEIIKRTTAVTKYYDEMLNSYGDSERDLKKKLYLTLMSINILEGVRFYVSFACSWAFAQQGKMMGNSQIISLIARDENLHLGFTQKLLRDLATKEDEGFVEIAKELEPTVIQMFKDAYEEEVQWAEYLFKDGSILGLNSEILTRYMKFLINQRTKSIGLQPIFEKTQNPINWINAYLDSSTEQVAPQEESITSYVVGSVTSDLSDTSFDTNEYDF